MERKLFLLGLLRSHKMHGYQLKKFIDSHLKTSVDLKKPTLYRLLNEMTGKGWISYSEEQEGARPPRRVYALTRKGQTVFQRMLRESLASSQPIEFPSDVSLMFLDSIPREEASSLLEKRRCAIKKLLQQAETHPSHSGNTELLLERLRRHYITELEWMDELITQIKTS